MPARTPTFWQSKNVIAFALWPFSFVFRLLVSSRHLCYRAGLFTQSRIDTPVIVIGNITAGGAGKTPLVIALARHLQYRGVTVGILCGGYGGSARGGDPIRVDAKTDPAIAGDEAVLIANQTRMPVVVSKDRSVGAGLLEEVLRASVDATLLKKPVCILCDDGLQHYSLHRDIEVVVVNAAQRFSNGFMLPAGPLREPQSRLHSVDVVCYSGEDHPAPGYRLRVDGLVNLHSDKRLLPAQFEQTRVRAVAGIAYPENFFKTLRLLGFDVVECALPDHHRFDQSTLQFDDNLPIIMTEKDSVKGREFAPQNTWYLAVVAVPDQALMQHFESWAQSLHDRLT